MKRVHFHSAVMMRLLHRGIGVAALTVFSGWLPIAAPLAVRSPLPWGIAVAQAQDLSAAELQSYAQALLEVEPVRLAALAQIQSLVGGGNVPQIACHRRESLASLDRNIRAIAVRYCDDSAAIVERRLPIQRFNAITSALERDRGLADRIQQEMRRLQN